jgi:hypothetical protein
MFKKVIKWTAISLGTIIGGPLIVAFSLGVYQGYQEVLEIEALEAELDEYLAMTDQCGEITSQVEYNNAQECKQVCGTFFDCRHEYLMMEYGISMAVDEFHSDVYEPVDDKKLDL